MSFNLFGPATVNDIKVGYISTTRGYVEGVSRYEANVYAQLNPGTQFIFKNRDLIRYLNINEVNALTPEDLLPNRIPTNGCDQESVNTFGLDIYNPDGSINTDAISIVTPGGGSGAGGPGGGSGTGVNVGSPRVYINGGGGVGAAANAVIGNDGSLLAVDVIDGGYGYRFPPQVDIVDLEGLGSGAVAIASLCPPDTVGTLQTFENEEDFEEYDLRTGAPPVVSFGRRQGANGEDLGEWDPSLYASLKVDPIRREIIAYQDFLNSIRDGWWDTRKAKPIEIIADDKKGNVKYDVQHWAWGGSREVKKIPSKKENFQEVEFKVYTQGGNQKDRDLMFTFVEKNGDHRFKIKAASFQDAKISKVKIKLKPNAVYTVNASGRYKGKGVEQGLIESFGRKPKERNGRFTDGTRIFADFVKSANDNDDLQIEATQGKFKTDNRRKLNGHSTFDLTYSLDASAQFKTEVVKKIDDSFMNRFAISPVPPSNVRGSDFAGIQYAFIYEENFPYDGEYKFKAMADNVGEVYIDNESIFQFRRFKGGPDVVKKFIKAGVHKIRCDLYNVPIKEKIKRVQPSPQPANEELLIDYRNLHPANKKINVSSDGTLIKLRDGDGRDTNSSLRIISSDVNARFSKDGRRLIYDTSKDGTIKVRFEWRDNPRNAGLAVERIRIGNRLLGSNRNIKSKKSGRDTDTITVKANKNKVNPRSTQSTGEKPTEIFNTLDYINKADRKLYRINPNAGRDSNFLNRFGVLPFNPAAVEREEVLVPVKSPPQPKPKASIIREGEKLFLKVTGGGRVRIKFKLTIDDNPNTAGLALNEVRINSDDNPVRIRRGRIGDSGRYNRGRYREKDTKFGEGFFTGGKTYSIKVIGGSSTSGFKTIDKTTVGFDDNLNNGYDENGLLRIDSVKIIEESDARYETKQNQVTKVVKRFPQKPNASTDAYAGIHVIRWEHVEFPVDGNYNITTMVDDNAKIFIGNRDGNGRKAIGNGLRSVEKGGDEVIIEKRGFAQGSSTGKSVDTRFFRKGKYRIRVELEQIPGKPLAKGNPMAFAMKIQSPGAEEIEVISARSWNENPMGVALKIDPPLPPIPQEPVPRAPGRCPNNPIWSTRFPDGEKKWWPVTHANQDGSKTWSKFMNRFAVSPIPPLNTKGTAGGGIVYSNSWNVEVPYDGFYGMKGTVDNGGRILIDGKVIMQGGYFTGAKFASSDRTLEGFGSETPQTVKFPLTKGNHTVTVEVENRAQTKQKRIKKTIFNTADWAIEQAIPVTQNNTYDVVYVDLHPRNKNLKVSGDRKTVRMLDGGGDDTNAKLIITSGDATFSDDGRKISGKGVVRARLEWNDNPNIKGIAVSGVVINGVRLSRDTKSVSKEKSFRINYEDLNPSNRTIEVSGNNSRNNNNTIKLKDGRGSDANVKFTIMSTSPGVSARFSDDGRELKVKGNGDVNIRIKYDDNPGFAGEAVRSITINGTKWTKKRTEYGEETKTLKITQNTAASTAFTKRGSDENNIDLGAKPAPGRGLSGGTTKRGVKYSGPELASYRRGTLGPFITPRFESDRDYIANFIGTKWTMKWTGVNFPVSTRYRIRTEADDILTVKVDGEFVSEVRVREGVREVFFNASEGKRTIEMELTNANIQQPFPINPTVFNAIIDVDAEITVPAERPWRANPVGISAILIPPPCPLETKGLGKLCDIFPLTPGNGYSPPPGTGYPAVLEVIRLEPVNPGINYGPDDPVCIIKSDGSKVCFPPNLGPFGGNLPIDTPPTPVTEYPNIFQSSPTGVNARFRPVIRVRRDPLDVEPEDILQVTDLVGLKRTGYVDGREYFGAVFYKDGVRFAGYYETPGQLIQVYDTLQESIDGEVTTRPSAILRQGTDITSNDPRLNIPGTPENLT